MMERPSILLLTQGHVADITGQGRQNKLTKILRTLMSLRSYGKHLPGTRILSTLNVSDFQMNINIRQR